MVAVRVSRGWLTPALTVLTSTAILELPAGEDRKRHCWLGGSCNVIDVVVLLFIFGVVGFKILFGVRPSSSRRQSWEWKHRMQHCRLHPAVVSF